MKFLLKFATLASIIAMLTTNIYAHDIKNETEIFEQTIEKKASASDPDLKIGIFYGSTAVPTTNLDNYTGSGHSFGYFDSTNTFIKLYETAVEEITIMKDKNIYLGSDGLYYDTALSNPKGIIGSHHVELSYKYANYSQAEYDALTLHSDAHVAYINGEYKIRIGSYSTEAQALSALDSIKSSTGDYNATVAYPNTNGFVVTNTKTTKILFEYSNGTNFGVMPKGTITWNKGYRYNGGFEYSRQDGNDVTVVNVVSMQDYIKGVVPYEMSGSWHIEALKAQALCARSYGFNNINKHSRYGFDLCNGVDCQVYQGTSRATENSDKAVDETNGEYINYNGSIATGFFHSSDGGATENSENVWVSTIGYLKGVIDIHENTEDVSNGIWSFTITNDQIKTILNTKGYSLSGVSNMYVKERTDMGNVLTLTVVDTSGKEYDFSKERARTILNSTSQGVTFNSTRYTINGVGNLTPWGDNPSYEQPEEVLPEEDTELSGNSSVYINDKEYSTENGFEVLTSTGQDYTSNLNDSYVITNNGINKVTPESETTKSSETSQISETTEEVIEQKSSNGSYYISGRGWGHNIGMSQYGAKAMAEKGYSYQEIIKFYFTGVEISKMS